MYTIPWTGPPRTSFSSYNQTVALTALLSAIQLVDDQSSLKSNPTPSHIPTATMTTSPLPRKKNTTGAIVGGVVGGLAILAVTIVCALLYRRRRRQGNHSPLVVDEHSPQRFAPFMVASVPVVAVETGATRMNVQTEPTTPQGAAARSLYLLHTERRDEIPTEELLRLLRERLHPSRWDDLDDELPPEYYEGRTTWKVLSRLQWLDTLWPDVVL